VLLLLVGDNAAEAAVGADGSCKIFAMLPFSKKTNDAKDDSAAANATNSSLRYQQWNNVTSIKYSFDALAATLMAIDDFNRRSSGIVRELADIVPYNCSVKLEDPLVADTKWDADQSLLVAIDQSTASDGPPPLPGDGQRKLLKNLDLCVVLGPASELPAAAVSTVTSALKVPQMVFNTASEQLLSVESPTTVGVSLSVSGEATSLVEYLQRPGFRRDYLVVLSQPGVAKTSDFAEAVAEIGLTRGLTVVDVKLDSTLAEASLSTAADVDQEYKSAVHDILSTGIKTIFLNIPDTGTVVHFANIFEENGMFDDLDFLYVLSPEAFPTDRLPELIGEQPPGSPLSRLLSGAMVLDRLDGFRYQPPDINGFLEAWRSMDASFVSRVKSLVPRDAAQAVADDFNPGRSYFQDTTPSNYVSFIYDAVMTIGLGGCLEKETIFSSIPRPEGGAGGGVPNGPPEDLFSSPPSDMSGSGPFNPGSSSEQQTPPGNNDSTASPPTNSQQDAFPSPPIDSTGSDQINPGSGNDGGSSNGQPDFLSPPDNGTSGNSDIFNPAAGQGSGNIDSNRQQPPDNGQQTPPTGGTGDGNGGGGGGFGQGFGGRGLQGGGSGGGGSSGGMFSGGGSGGGGSFPRPPPADLRFQLLDPHVLAMTQVSFHGASGLVHFEEGKKVRDPADVSVGVYNIRPIPSSERRLQDASIASENQNVTFEVNLVSIWRNASSNSSGWDEVQGESFMYRDGSTIPPSNTRDFVDMNLLPGWVRGVGLTLMVVAWILALTCAGGIFVLRNDGIMKRSQPFFMQLLCFGSFIMSMSILTLSFDEGSGQSEQQLSHACMATPWFFFLGQIMVFSALFTKLWRLDKVLQFRRGNKVTIVQVIGPLAGLLCVALLILIIWTAVDPWSWVRVTINQLPAQSYGQCSSAHFWAFFGPLMALLIVAEGLTAFFAWKTSDVPEDFRDTNAVLYAIVTQLQAWVIGVPILSVLNTSSAAATYFGRVLLIWIFAVSSVGLVVAPKLFRAIQLRRHPELVHKKGSRVSVTGLVAPPSSASRSSYGGSGTPMPPNNASGSSWGTEGNGRNAYSDGRSSSQGQQLQQRSTASDAEAPEQAPRPPIDAIVTPAATYQV